MTIHKALQICRYTSALLLIKDHQGQIQVEGLCIEPIHDLFELRRHDEECDLMTRQVMKWVDAMAAMMAPIRLLTIQNLYISIHL